MELTYRVMTRRDGCCFLLGLICAAGGCERKEEAALPRTSSPTASAHSMAELTELDPCSIILIPPRAAGRAESEITRLQYEVKGAIEPALSLEKLGWAFIHHARASLDDFYYTLAEHCARCLDRHEPGSYSAMLLRGHALHNQHRFKEAEPIARDLVAKRGLPFDYGLLADVLMELGRVDEAAAACQTMIDLRPDLQSYSRGAHIRWLKGDLRGAVELME